MNLTDQELDRRLAGLDRACEPPPDAWPLIADRLTTRRRPGWPWLAAVAALAGITVGLMVLLGDPETGPSSLPGSVVQGPESEPWRPALERQPVFDAAWKENRNAIARLEQALTDEPGNLLLQEFLAEAHLRQASLVELAMRTEALHAPVR